MTWELAARIVAVLVVAYLLGGISWALVIGKQFYGIDVREYGSGNLGATNVLRALGLPAAIATFLLDAAKGSAAVGFAVWIVPRVTFGDSTHTWAMFVATMAAILGHSYSPYLRFRGGKGVATAAGAVFVITPIVLVLALVVFGLVVVLSRMVSLGSVVATAVYPLLCLAFYPRNWLIFGFGCVAAGLVIWRHRANIGRIARGEEPKISFERRESAE